MSNVQERFLAAGDAFVCNVVRFGLTAMPALHSTRRARVDVLFFALSIWQSIVLF